MPNSNEHKTNEFQLLSEVNKDEIEDTEIEIKMKIDPAEGYACPFI